MTTSIDLRVMATWLAERGLGVVVLVVVVYLALRAIPGATHRLVGPLSQRATPRPDAGEPAIDEARKRAATIEQLIDAGGRLVVLLVAGLVFLTWFDLIPVIAGLGVLAAAITIAGQSIVLDYLMGVLIVLERTYYTGDWVRIGDVEGEVEELGLRRTTLRDASGTVHSVSNGVVRVASNLTRVYARMNVEVTVTFSTDLDRATAILRETGAAMAADPEWASRLLEPPSLLRVEGLGDLGVTLRITGKVRAADRWSAPSELRKRIVAAFQANAIEMPVRAGGPPAGPSAREG